MRHRYLCTCLHFEDEHVIDAMSNGGKRCTACTCDEFEWKEDATALEVADAERREREGRP